MKGWIGQGDSSFDELENGRSLVREIRGKVLEHYEQIIDADAFAARERMLSKLKKLSDELKQKLSSSGRRADIDRAIALLESDAGEWSKEQWLHLNWMCNRYSSMLRNTVYEDYATVNHMARSIGGPMQKQLQAEINAFDLCTVGEVESALQAVWLDWERDHTDLVDELLADSELRGVHEGVREKGMLFNVRARALGFARQTCEGLPQGMMRPPSEISTVELFYQDLLKRGAAKTAAFDRVVRTLDPKQHEAALRRTLERMKGMEREGKPCFPVIKSLAGMEDKNPIKLASCGFDGLVRWAEKKQGHFLGIQEREELMILFMQFRDQLMKEVNAVN